jgi:hypothetical protein
MRDDASGTRVIAGLLLSITKVRDAPIVNIVIPAKAGIHCLLMDPEWIPAFAGMTRVLRKTVTCSGNS